MAFRSNSIRFARWILKKFFVQFQKWNNQTRCFSRIQLLVTTWMIHNLGSNFYDTVKSWQPICINFYLWGNIKDKIYGMCSCMEEELNTWKFLRNNCESMSVFLNSKRVYVCSDGILAPPITQVHWLWLCDAEWLILRKSCIAWWWVLAGSQELTTALNFTIGYSVFCLPSFLHCILIILHSVI